MFFKKSGTSKGLRKSGVSKTTNNSFWASFLASCAYLDETRIFPIIVKTMYVLNDN